MGVATHLGIRLAEYDQRIRTFIPHYEEMLDGAAATVATLAGPDPRVVDLGTGSGLSPDGSSARVLERVSPASMLTMACSASRANGCTAA